MEKLELVCQNFKIAGTLNRISPFGEGLINSSYLVTMKDSPTGYVLQKINHNIFRDVETLQNNIYRITSHIRRKLEEKGEADIDRKVLTLVETLNGKLYYCDSESYWRMTVMIPQSRTFQMVNAENSYYAGKAFGHFQAMLADIPGEPLGESIPDFHNMSNRQESLRKAVKKNLASRLHEVSDLVKELEERAEEMCMAERLHQEGALTKRINHCDTKVNNLLFDQDGKVLCVIDLDTAMPGFVSSDFGDFMRTAGNTGREDDTDLAKVNFNMEIFRAYTRGYLEEAKDFLTPVELEILPFGARLLTYMQTVRFLTDYLNGDTYYKITYPHHNLDRTRAQFKLLESIEENYQDMLQYIRSINLPAPQIR
jgi:Ser/Thr protein kinase RdoA (MazF antagonist)